MGLWETIKKNRDIIVIFVAVVFVIFISYISLSRKAEVSTDTFISPFSSEISTSVDAGVIDLSTTRLEGYSDTLSVYSVRTFTLNEADKVVENLGFASITPEASAKSEAFVWENGDNIARYNPENGVLTITTDLVKLSDEIEMSFKPANAEDYFKTFVKTYISSENEISAEVDANDGSTIIQGSWLVGGYQIVEKFGEEYSVIAEFDQRGNLESLYASLLVIEPKAGEVMIMPLRELRSYIGLKSFPKEFFVDVIPGNDPCNNPEECDPYGLNPYESFTETAIETAELVYYFSNDTNNTLLPVYRLKGIGRAEGELGFQNVSVTVFVNALYPSQIVVPTTK